MSKETGSHTGLLRLACAALAIVMFLAALSAVTVLDLRLLTSKKGISQILSQALSSALPTPPVLTLAVGYAPVVQSEAASDGLLTQWLYEQLQEAYGGEAPFTLDQVGNFVEKSTLKEFIADKFSGVVDDFYAQRGTVITEEEIIQLIDENAALLEQETGYTITDSLKQEVIDGINSTGMLKELEEKGLYGILTEQLGGSGDAGDDADDDSLSSGNELTAALESIRKATSYTAAAIAIVLYLACAVGYFFAARKRIPGTLVGCGIPLLLVGLIYAPATLLFLAGNPLGDSVIATVAAIFFRVTAPVNLTVFFLGLAMIIAAIVLRVISKKKAPQPEPQA